jgi:hypothetical protein
MNDTASLLLATTILALGGLGLYMYKTSDDQNGGYDDYNEDEIFSNNDDIDDINEEEYEYEPKPKTRNGGKTKRSRKSSGTKRRY